MIVDTAAKPQPSPFSRARVMLTLTFAILALTHISRAQIQAPPLESQSQVQQPPIDSQIEVVRADMQADKAAVITAAMDFSDKDAAAFWPVYREYDRQRAFLEDSRVAVIKEYAQKYPDITDAEAKEMAERMFEYESRLAALKKIYYKKLNKVLPALTVTKFFQLDRRMDLMIDMKVESSLPPLTAAQPASTATSN